MMPRNSNLGKWDGWYAGLTSDDMGAFRYGDTETYEMAAEFLSDMSTVEDWGCGAGGFKRFCKPPYIGIDGSHTPFADKIVDLSEYKSSVDSVMMRHVLEHNYEWERVLDNAIASFKRKMCLVLFTPLQEGPTTKLADNKVHGVDVPDLAFNRVQLEAHFDGLQHKSIILTTDTGYGLETIYFINRP